MIAFAFASDASGSASADQQFQAFASGQYDSVIKGIVQSWVNQGFTNLVFRPGWEMNMPGPTYAGDSAQDQADWVAAFQHVSTVLHQTATALGVHVQVVWNPGTINYSNAEATTNLYPGNQYVDITGADAYSDLHPYSDEPGATDFHDWDTNNEDSTVAQFIADPVNREHYWSYPAATEWSNDSSGGHSQSLDSLIQFAEAMGKPFAIPETGAGNPSNDGDVQDDAAFPQWLAEQLTAAQAQGETISFVNLWDSNGGGNYEFSFASDDKPGEAAAWAEYFGAQTGTAAQEAGATPPNSAASSSAGAAVGGVATIGSGRDTLALTMSERAAPAGAQFTVSIDGIQIGGVQTTGADILSGQMETFDVDGTFAAGTHSASITFLNAQNSLLMVDNASLDGVGIGNGATVLSNDGSSAFSFAAPGTAAAASTVATAQGNGSGPDTVALVVSERAEDAGARFTVAVDGVQFGGIQTTSANVLTGQTQEIDLLGTLAPGSHSVAIDYLNASNSLLFINSVAINGNTVGGSNLVFSNNGVQSLSASTPESFATTTVGHGPDTLALAISEDYYAGNAQFTVSVNGQQVDGVQTATAIAGNHQTQAVDVLGTFTGTHTVSVDFLNDDWGGTASTDRNLYVGGATIDGTPIVGSSLALLSEGTQSFTFNH